MSLKPSPCIIIIVAVCLPLLLAGCPLSRRGGSPEKTRRGSVNAPPAVTCPLDGGETTGAAIVRRPLAVMIENSPRARPQSGLLHACRVYEGITEGGITRFLAIFLHGDPAMIGPVRSARPHFIYLAKEYSPVYVHCGESYEALQVLIRMPWLRDLDQLKYEKPFWRDRARHAPHNLYTSTEKLRQFMLKQEWEGQAEQLPLMSFGGKVDGGTPAPIIAINFGGAVRYKLRFEYDAALGAYKRYMDGKLHIDRETGQPILAKNIIIQRVTSERFTDNTLGTYDVRVMGAGVGEFLTLGQRIPLKWQKDYIDAVTVYTDDIGRALPYQVGQTWVELVQEGGKVTFEQPTPPTPPATSAPESRGSIPRARR